MKKKVKYINKKQDSRININIKETLKQVESGINDDGVFIFTSLLIPEKFAKKLGKYTQEIVKFFFIKGKIINLNNELSKEQMGEFCLESGYDFKWEKDIDEDNFLEEVISKSHLQNIDVRPPVVTIMGHVDHGKTTLLDKIRNANLASSEVGGITQRIGAYTVEFKEKKITFLDTPGHEAFSQMRSRGANITDIVILVVAADDGVKPQTIEAIDHAKAANSPIIVFINKMDKAEANPEKVIAELSEYNLLSEEWGGDTIFIKGSAISGEKIDLLLESIILSSDILELKCLDKSLANGVVIESYLDKGLGPVASLLVRNGTLIKGDFIVVGSFYGKVRKMINDKGEDVDIGKSSTPISICGINGVPSAGDKFIVTKNEKDAKDLIEKRIIKHNIFNINQVIDEADKDKKILKIVFKAEINGSLQAVINSLSKIDVEGAKLILIRAAVGPITESDVSLAKASKAIIYGLNLQPSNKVSDLAKSEDVIIKYHNIIFHLKEEIEGLLLGKLDPIYEEEVLGHAEVRQLWSHSEVGIIAGCRVIDGEIIRSGFARVIRNGNTIVDKRRLTSLKTGKEPAKTVTNGKDCGLTIDNFSDIILSDIIEVYKLVKKNSIGKS